MFFRGSCALTSQRPGVSGSPALLGLWSLPCIDLTTWGCKSQCQASLPLPALDAKAMWPTRPSSWLHALWLLVMVFFPRPGPRGGSGNARQCVSSSSNHSFSSR